MFCPAKKPFLIPFLSLALVVLALTSGLFHPAYCESQPRARFKQYIKELYYATKIQQVSKFWIKNARVPYDELLGTAAAAKLVELKDGYVYNPQITTEILDGNVCTMKGTGMAQSKGYRVNADINVIMRFEEGNWKIQYYTWAGHIPGSY
jgi:hypothetical protein